MALRDIVKIDESLCTGCGDCVPACAEGAIEIVDGVAKLKADNLCDGLGACLGDCPVGAITIEQRDADAFDEQAVESIMEKSTVTATSTSSSFSKHAHASGGGCPGSRMMQLDGASEASDTSATVPLQPSALRQWPVQLHLVSPTAPYFHRADVVLAADCVAFSLGDFHQTWLKNRALAIACPKLDNGQEIYLEKLISMIDESEINTLTVMIMEVPCCGGLLGLAREAVSHARRRVPVKRVVVGLKGTILREEWV